MSKSLPLFQNFPQAIRSSERRPSPVIIRVVLAGFVLLCLVTFTQTNSHEYLLRHASFVQMRFGNEYTAIKQFTESIPNAYCEVPSSKIAPVSPCPAVPICKSRSELLQSYANGHRLAFDGPFCYASCRPRWYSQDQICSVLNKYERIVLLGDSLIRHLYQGFLMLASGNMHSGSLASWKLSNGTTIDDCTCSKAFQNHACRELLPSRYRHDSEQNGVELKCSSQAADIVYLQFLGVEALEEKRLWSWQTDDLQAQAGRIAVLAGNGPWDSYDPAKFRQLSQALFNYLLQRNSNTRNLGSSLTSFVNAAHMAALKQRVDMLWVLPPAAAVNKPAAWVETQGNPKILSMYASAEATLDQLHVPYMARWNHTEQAASYDGTHFGILPAMEQAMVLLNYIDLP